ncbi:hypothetical protein PENSUB_7704 [Penicillium subrubescens]|uniref:Uncharacterized protein n=1 Tax=Penicillium subrubescens TaxID=1316194 RepID=A0A1Q5TKL8_9EURO|nr:hypothetical protein PENSUB_7704 [Penicillium subrubescens]
MSEQEAEDVLVLAFYCNHQRIIREVDRASYASSGPLQKEIDMRKAARLNCPGQRCVAGDVHLPRVGSVPKENPHDPER